MSKPTETGDPDGQREDVTPAVLRFLVSHLSGRLGRTHLLKLVYLSDLEARRYLGHPISRLQYTWHHHGPFDKAFYEYVEQLKREGSVTEETLTWPTGASGSIYRFSGTIAPAPFTRGEETILAYIARAYGQMRLDALLDDVVYETEPMRAARASNRQGTRLAMSRLDNQARREHGGVDLERLLESEEQVREGRGVGLEDLARDLLGPPDR